MGTSRLVRLLDRSVLRPAGFSLRGSTWNRTSHSLVDVVTVVPSKGGGSLDVYLGVHDPVIFERVWGPHRGSVIEADCLARIEIGELPDVGRRSWHPDDPSHQTVIREAMENAGLRWLDRMHDKAALVDFLQTSTYARVPAYGVMLALLEDEIGRHEVACERLRALAREVSGLSPAWESKIKDLSAVIGCPPFPTS